MSLRLLIDEDSQALSLVNLLRDAGYDVVTANEVELMSQPDSVVLRYARETERILLTHNCQDFQALHDTNPDHPGILAVYRDANFSNNMSRKAIVRAIANLIASGIPLTNQFVALNHWNY